VRAAPWSPVPLRSAARAIFRSMRGVITRRNTGLFVHGTANGTGSGLKIARDRVPDSGRAGLYPDAQLEAVDEAAWS
jgi:hypothetical protein